jgi:hypothetical protein
MFVSCGWNLRQDHNIRRSNKSFDSVAKFRYFGTTQVKTALMRNWEHIKFEECVLLFGPENLVFPLAV